MLLSSSAYFAPLTYWAEAIRQGSWQWEAQENYQKGGFRNRCHIAGPNRVELLTIPLVKGKHQSTPIQEVAISYQTDWVRHHRLSIQAAYGRAPFFEFYADELFAVLANRPTSLWQLNWSLQQLLIRNLQLDLPFSATEDFQASYATKVLDLRPRKSASTITLRPYPQLFQDRFGFQSDLSVLDLLFCQGPAAGVYLREYEL